MPAKHKGKGKDSRRKRKMSHQGQALAAKVVTPIRVYDSRPVASTVDMVEERPVIDGQLAENSSALRGELRLIGIIGTVLVAVLILLSIIL